jgi:acetolactate synthase-1/3 small subunit
MRHVLSAVVQNVPGVLAHISGMLASRGYNIDSLAVGETENPDLSRMTFVVVGDGTVLEQVRKQLEKVVTVVKVVDISSQDFVERDLMLIKVRAPRGGGRSEIKELAEIFRGRIVDVAGEEVIVEISGQERRSNRSSSSCARSASSNSCAPAGSPWSAAGRRAKRARSNRNNTDTNPTRKRG